MNGGTTLRWVLNFYRAFSVSKALLGPYVFNAPEQHDEL